MKMLVPAISAGAVKTKIVAVNLAVIKPCYSVIKALVARKAVNIKNRAAFFANKMCVRRGHSVVTLLTVNIGNGNCKPLFFKQSQIAIDRTKAEIRIIVLKLVVNPFG